MKAGLKAILGAGQNETWRPATCVIDGAGVVRWKFVEVDYNTRPSNEYALARVKKADANIK
jgi:hypothetical protein